MTRGMGKKIAIAAGCAALLAGVLLGLRAHDAERDAEGRVTLKSSDATISFGTGSAISKMPAWVPVYSGSKPEGVYLSETREQTRNTYSFKTADPATKVAAFFEDRLKANGFAVTPMIRGDAGGMVSAETENKKRTVEVTIAPANGSTQVSVMAIEKK